MRSLCMAFVTMVMVSFGVHARADDLFHPARVSLFLYGEMDIDRETRLEYRFVPAGNLIGTLNPLAYLGVKTKATDWLGIEAYGGYLFGQDIPLVSLSLNPKFGRWWAWTENDLHISNKGGYWFIQVDYQFLKWLYAGCEGDGWGAYGDNASWSHGGGPNILLRLGKMVGVDFALHVRNLDHAIKPEFVLRTHLFL